MESVVKFVYLLANKGVKLSVDGDQLVCYAPNGSLTKDIKEGIAEHKSKIISFLRGNGECSLPVKGDIVKAREFPLSVGQKGLYILQKLHPEMSAYNVPLCFKISNKVDVEALGRAWEYVLEQYPILAARIAERDGAAWHCLDDSCRTVLQYQSIDDTDDRQVLLFLQKHAKRPFDLDQGPLVRIDLFGRRNQDSLLLLTVHHIIFDGTSGVILLKSLFGYYQQLCRGEKIGLSHELLGYQEFVAWEEAMLASAEGRSHAEFWQQQLDGDLPGLELLPDLPRPASFSYQGKTLIGDLPDSLSGRVHDFCRSRSLQPAVLFLAVFQLLLHRYTRQDEIIVGMPVMGRAAQKFAEEMGYFINMVPLRTHCGRQLKAGEFFRKVQGTMLDALYHSSYPFPLMLDKLRVKQADKNPVFQISYAYQNFDLTSLLQQEALGLEIIKEISQEGDFDLGLEVYEERESFGIHIKYNPELYTGGTIKRFFEHYCVLLEEIFKAPDLDIHEYPILTAAEKQRLLVGYNDTRADYPRDKCIHQLFAEQVAINPDKIAVLYKDEQISYLELYEKSYELAIYLQSLGVKPDSLIGLCVERSLDMIVGLLGILLSGSAYVPLDPSYPDERLSYMLQDSQATIVLTQGKLQEKMTALIDDGANLIALDVKWKEIRNRVANLKTEKVELNRNVTPDHLAYVIYTSGSTGKPKGVMVRHGGLTNFLQSMAEKPGMNKEDKLLAITTYCFDIAALELYLPLIRGAQLCICFSEELKDGEMLKSAIGKYRPTVMQATPTTWQMLFYAGWENNEGLKILCGGEALSESLKKKFIETNSQAWNMYGPTETTIWSTIQPIVENNVIAIGTPIANTQIYILDPHGNLQPVGVPGELHIAGDGLARGYLNRPELTQEKFVPERFSSDGRMYKTGDLARWLGDGTIEYLGRMDDQVKVRGFRIETGEIEAALNQHPYIEDSVVVVQGGEVNKILVGFYTVKGSGRDVVNLTSENIRDHLKKSLPEYMLPSAFVRLDVIPQTPNGKIDRRALRRLDVNMESSQAFLAPRNKVEEELVYIWGEVLNIEPDKIGVNDNFFELGGHSLLVISLISNMKRRGYNFLTRDVMSSPSISQLASLYMERPLSEMNINYEYRQGDSIFSLPNKQKLFQGLFKNHWNMTGLVKINDADFSSLQEALRLLFLEHEGLSHRFYLSDEGVVYEEVAPEKRSLLERIDLSALEGIEEKVKRLEEICDGFQFSLNLSERLYRFVLFDLGEGEASRLLIVIHHSLIDAYSVPIFIEELTIRYLSLISGIKCDLPPKTSSITEWGYCLHKYANDLENINHEIDYWSSLPWAKAKVLMDFPDGWDKNRSNNPALYGQDVIVEKELDEEASNVLLSNNFDSKTITKENIIFSAFVNTISTLTKSDHVYFEMEVSGRASIVSGIDLSRTIGWFADTVPVVIEVNDNLILRDQILSYQKQLKAIPGSGIGFNAIRYMNSDPAVRRRFKEIPDPEFKINLIPYSTDQSPQNKNLNLPWHLMSPSAENPGRANDPVQADLVGAAAYILVQVTNGKFVFKWICRDNMYKKETLESALELWLAETRKIVGLFPR